MSVRVRLTRVGSKKNPIWRVVVADQRSPRDGRFIETIGQYNPQTQPSTIRIDDERLEHWLARGAQASNTVKQLMKAQVKSGGPTPEHRTGAGRPRWRSTRKRPPRNRWPMPPERRRGGRAVPQRRGRSRRARRLADDAPAERRRRPTTTGGRPELLVEKLLEYLARSLVDEPDEVSVESFEEDDGTVVLELRVADDDAGQVIGRGGRTVAALRTVVKAAAVRHDRRVLVDVVD